MDETGIEKLQTIVGKTVALVSVADGGDDDVGFERLVVCFTDGSSVSLKSRDAEGYSSWFDLE